jgi:TonB family protein
MRQAVALAIVLLGLLPMGGFATEAGSDDVLDLTQPGAVPPGITRPVLVVGWRVSYPERALRMHEQGSVTLTFTVERDGTVTDSKITESSGSDRIDGAAIDSVLRRKYQPAMKDGVPIRARTKTSIEFALPRGNLPSPAQTLPQPVAIRCLELEGDEALAACNTLAGSATGVAASTIYFRRGHLLNEKGLYEKAVDDFGKGLRLEPSRTDALRERGYAYERTGQLELALQDFDRALALLPDSPQAPFDKADILRLRGFTYEKRGDYQKAIDNYSDAMKAKERNSVATMDRGLAYEMLGRADLAVADFKSAAEMAPDCGKPGCKPGSDAQIAVLDQRINQNPDDVTAFGNRCIQRSLSGRQLSMALADCNHVQARIAGEPDTLEARGLIFMRMGQYGDAIQDFDAALATAPRRAASIYLRGVAKLRSGDATSAHADFLTSREINYAVAVNMAAEGILPI